MPLRRVGSSVLCGVVLVSVVIATMVWEPSQFGFHRVSGVTELSQSALSKKQLPDDREVIEVVIAPGLCGPNVERITLQAVFDHYGLSERALLDRAIELNYYGRQPRTDDDRAYYAQSEWEPEEVMLIPLGLESAKESD